MPKELNLSLQQLENLALQYGTPYQIYDEKMIRDNVNKFLDVFRKEFPSFRQFFAVKALPDPTILKILLDCGLGLDCSSPYELYVAKKIGAAGSDIIYTSNYTSKEDIDYAVSNNVILNLDDIDILEHADSNKCDLICFRLNPRVGKTDSESDSNILGGANTKFGINSDLIIEAYAQAKLKGFTRFGIHCMSGSCVMDPTYWYTLLNVMYETIDKLNSDLGIQLEFINLGGGIGIPYYPGALDIDIGTIAKNIRKAINENNIKYRLTHEPNIYMENGRYITGPFGWLVSRCQSIKKNTQIFYGVDACMANLMRPGMYGAYHHITIPRLQQTNLTNDNSNVHEANVVGTLCENNDWFARKRLLPNGIQKGDLFVIYDCGAHATSMGFNYNGKLKCSELLLEQNGNIKLIKRKETFDDLLEKSILDMV